MSCVRESHKRRLPSTTQSIKATVTVVDEEQYAQAVALINIELEELRVTVDQFALHNIGSDKAWAAAIESHRRIKVLEETTVRNLNTLRKQNP
jgi:hypothetical protein